MKYITKENIILALLVFVIFQSFFKSPEGISEEEHLLKIKIHDQSQEIMVMKKSRNQDKIIIKKFQDEYLKIDSISDNYTDEQLDSSMSDFFNRH